MIRLVHFGLGPIGCAVVTQVARRQGISTVGAIDIDPAKAGRDVGEVAGLDCKLGITVEPDAMSVLKAVKPDVVALCTSSSLQQVAPQIEMILRAGIPVISTTEELSYPVGANRSLAAHLDQLAREADVAVLGTGVNPGFVMDTLAIVLSAACEKVESIEVDRIQDARLRRLPFQKKIGAGMGLDEFNDAVARGIVRHVGLAESITMIADSMAWKLDGISDEVLPVPADHRIDSGFGEIQAGQVCGLTQKGIGYRDGHPVITLRMEAYLGAPESYDAVRIHGSPPISMKLSGGVHGDLTTAAMVINCIPSLLAAQPGLRTMRDLALPSWFGGIRSAGGFAP